MRKHERETLVLTRMLFQRPPPSDERLVLKELGFLAARPPGTFSTPRAYDVSLHVCERFIVHANENETQRGMKTREHFNWGCLDLSRMLCPCMCPCSTLSDLAT